MPAASCPATCDVCKASWMPRQQKIVDEKQKLDRELKWHFKAARGDFSQQEANQHREDTGGSGPSPVAPSVRAAPMHHHSPRCTDKNCRQENPAGEQPMEGSRVVAAGVQKSVWAE